MKNLNMKL